MGDDDPPDDQYSLELFQRAMLQGDTLAREVLQQHFSGVVRGWMCLHPVRDEACCSEQEEYYVIQTFERFWEAPTRLEFSTLSAVLRCLQVSLNSVLMDTVRTHLRPQEISRPGSAGESAATARKNGEEVWKRLQSLLSNGREERLAYLLFHCGLKPGEIICSCPQEFSDAGEISRLRHNIIKRVLLDQVNAP